MTDWIERRALRIVQDPEAPLYLFALSAGDVSHVADVARISRDAAGKLIGYQRPEKRSHVNQILSYLDSGEVLFPNGLILALPDTVRFKSSRGPATSDGLATAGTLEIPLPADPAAPRPAWIVDGQQRSLALARTRNQNMAIPVAGFVTSSLPVQREQFLRVNTVQPVPASLAIELLPELPSVPSNRLAAKRLPSALVDMLNSDPESPFRGMIRRASTDSEDRRHHHVTDTSLVEAIKESLEHPSGVLFAYRDMAAGTTDTAAIRQVLLVYWTAVQQTFPEAWALPASESRLMHGVGIRAMGRLMERVMPHIDARRDDAVDATRGELKRIVDDCHWTAGVWDDLGVPWNELQNTSRHISQLSNVLARRYLSSRQARV